MAQHAGGTSRRRGAALEDALLTAAWDEVTAVGYAKFTMEGAAARAGAARSVLYRRWPNRAALVHAAMRHHMGSLDDRVPDTGDLRTDILLVLRDIRGKFLEVGPEVVHGLMSEATDLPPELMEVTPPRRHGRADPRRRPRPGPPRQDHPPGHLAAGRPAPPRDDAPAR